MSELYLQPCDNSELPSVIITLLLFEYLVCFNYTLSITENEGMTWMVSLDFVQY